jgi:hypothetical protein
LLLNFERKNGASSMYCADNAITSSSSFAHLRQISFFKVLPYSVLINLVGGSEYVG